MRRHWKTIAAAAIPVGGLLLGLGLALASPPLLLVGGIVHGTGLLLSAPRLLGAFRKREAAEKANFALVVILVLTLVGLLCYISTRRFARMDWTTRGSDQMGRHELHASTLALLETIDRPVDVTVIRANNPGAALWRDAVVNMLEEFRARNPLISVRELNMAARPGRVEEMAQRLNEPRIWPFSVVFESADSHMIVGSAETISSLGEGRQWIFSGEAAFALALERLTEPERPVVYVRTEMLLRPAEGTPRASLSRAVATLRRERYDVRRLPETARRVPEDADLLILAGRQGELPRELVEAVESFVALEGGRLLILADPGEEPDAAAALDRLAGPHVDIRTDAVAVGTVIFPYGQTAAVTEVPVGFSTGEHPIATNLAELGIEFTRACPVQMLDAPPTAETEPVLLLVSTSSTGWGETDLDAALGTGPGSVSYDEEEDISRPVLLGAGIAAPGAGVLGTMGPPQPRTVVIGSTRSFTDAGLKALAADQEQPASDARKNAETQVVPNLQLLRNSANWLVREADLPNITPRLIRANVTPLPRTRLLRLLVAFLGLLPLAVVVLGVTVWRLRRR